MGTNSPITEIVPGFVGNASRASWVVGRGSCAVMIMICFML